MPPPTTEDLLQRAAAAADAAERARWLAEAEAAADEVDELLRVARAWADLGDRAAAVLCLHRAADQAGDRVWPVQQFAAECLRLGDRAAAVRFLERLEGRWRGAALRGRERSHLAEAFVEVLGDRDAARRCLAAAENAGDVDDLCSSAWSLLRLGDRDTARRLLGMADARSSPARERGTAFSLIVGWRAVGDEKAALRVLEDGLATAADVDACTSLAQAWAGRRTGAAAIEPVARCLRKAASLARTTDAWLALAATMRDLGADATAVRAALGSAAAAARVLDDRRRIALRLLAWYGEHDPTLGPPGLRPEEIVPPGRSVCGFACEGKALFEWLRVRIDAARLEHIAAAEVAWEIEHYREALLPIVRDGIVLMPLDWEPSEVLAYCHHERGPDVDHVVRAFCGTVLCLASIAGEDRILVLADKLALLAESCIALGPEPMAGAVGLLAARFERGDTDEFAAVHAALALLVVAARIDPHDARLDALAARVLAQLDGDAPPSDWPPEEPLLGLVQSALAALPAPSPALAELRRRLQG